MAEDLKSWLAYWKGYLFTPNARDAHSVSFKFKPVYIIYRPLRLIIERGPLLVASPLKKISSLIKTAR